MEGEFVDFEEMARKALEKYAVKNIREHPDKEISYRVWHYPEPYERVLIRKDDSPVTTECKEKRFLGIPQKLPYYDFGIIIGD